MACASPRPRARLTRCTCSARFGTRPCSKLTGYRVRSISSPSRASTCWRALKPRLLDDVQKLPGAHLLEGHFHCGAAIDGGPAPSRRRGDVPDSVCRRDQVVTTAAHDHRAARRSRTVDCGSAVASAAGGPVI
jgi:hypothetical protein